MSFLDNGIRIYIKHKEFSVQYFYLFLLMEQEKKQGKMVNMITNMMHMRFSPQLQQTKPLISGNSFIVSKIKSFLSRSSTAESLPLDLSQDTESNKSTIRDGGLGTKHRLKFLEKLTTQHILIGNQYQLDLIDISSIHNQFVNTEHLWSMKCSPPIDYLTIDMKRLLIVVSSQKEKLVQIFRYNHRKISSKPLKIKSLQTNDDIKSICFLKGDLVIMTEGYFQVWSISIEDQIKKKAHTTYPKPKTNQLKFYIAPEPFQTTLNIFFQESSQQKRIFTLWLIQVQSSRKDFKVSYPQKIYDIKKSLEKKIILKNFSKQFFLMNLGSQILTFKKGYVLDSAYINLKNQNSILKYHGDETLIHLSDRKFQIYSFTLNTKKKPYKIKVAPIDAINISKPKDSEYFNMIEVMNGNFMIVFQIKGSENRKTRGQIEYWFTISQKISINQKVDFLFESKSLASYSKEELLDKCDTAEKMGLKPKEIYLELWSRSTKSTDNDFLLLVNTKDYQTIQQEIIAKLRKASISYKRIQKNENLSLDMLEQEVFTSKCSLKILHNYVLSHFWLKKLKYFQLLSTYQTHNTPEEMESSKSFGLGVSIQDFYELKNLHVKNQIISLINCFCLDNKQVTHRIRFLLTHFRMVILMSYHSILEEVIKNTKGKFLKLLQQVPQFLPYTPDEQMITTYIPTNFKKGIWSEISKAERQQNLNLEKLQTYDNEMIVKEFSKDIWFRQSFFQGHGVITESLQKIQSQLLSMKSQVTFFSAIQLILENVKQKDERKEIFKYIEETYPIMPGHLKDKIILYYRIYHYLLSKNILPYKKNLQRNTTFHEFLAFQNHDLFHYLFDQQRSVKGLILKQIKPIYEECSDNGVHFFNQNLADYFRCQFSTISDLKYILNRINNEKKQFHLKNVEMCEILVLTMGYKLIIGSAQDVPLEEILIYVQNILVEKRKQTSAKLRIIKSINKNADVLRLAKLNMSVEQIINSPHETMGKMIDYFITKEKVRGEYNEKIFLDKTYQILTSVEILYYDIYKESNETSYFIFFLFLAKIGVDVPSIPFLRLLLNDQHLKNQFNFDQSIAESLVLYIYKVKMNQNPIYISHEKYLRSLMTLLPEENEVRQFIICQFEFAKLLTHKPYVVEYPLSDNQPSPGLIDLEYYLNQMKASHVLSIDVEQVYQLMSRMAMLNARISRGVNFMEDDEQKSVLSSIFYEQNTRLIKRREVYEEFILRFIDEGLIREALPFVEKFLTQSDDDNHDYDIIYPLILLAQIEDDISIKDRALFRQAAVRFFTRPSFLFSIIKDYLLRPLTNRQRTQFLKLTVLEQNLSVIKGFDLESQLLSQQLIKIAKKQQLESSLIPLLQNCFNRVESHKQQFLKMEYNLIFTMMINSPYVVAKYMVCNKKFITLKNIRVFLTYLYKEDVFNPLAVLEYSRRLFLIVLYSLVDQKSIHDVVEIFAEYPLDVDLPDIFTPHFDESISFFDRLWKSSEAFKNQKRKRIREKMYLSLEAQQNIYEQKLVNPVLIGREKPIEYEKILEDNEPQNAQFKDEIKNSKRIIKQIDPSTIVQKLTKTKKYGEELDVQGLKRNEINEMFLNPESKRSSLNENMEFCIKIYEAQEKSQISGISEIQKTNKSIEKIIKESSLSRKNSVEEEEQSCSGSGIAKQIKNLLELEEKNIFTQKEEKTQNISQQDKSPQKSLIKRQNEASYEQSSSFGSYDEKEVVLTKKQWIGQKKYYLEVEGLPPVQEVGTTLLKENLLNLEAKARKIFQISNLKSIDAHPKFSPQYLQNLIKYLYYQSQGSSYNGIIYMIDYLIIMYPEVNIDRKSLQIFIRGENMQKKYNLDLELRHVFPIEAIFSIKYQAEIIFEKIFPTLTLFVDDINIFKLAKMIALTFQKAAFEDELLYYQLNKILDHKSTEQNEGQKKLDNIGVFIDKLSHQMLIQKFEQIYNGVKEEESRSLIIDMSLQKVQKKGTKREKVQFLEKVANHDSSYRDLLTNMRRL